MSFFDVLGDIGKIAFPVPYFANKFAGDLLGLGGSDVPGPDKIAPPPPPPDLTDEEVQKARVSARRRALMGAGIGSTFLSGPLGDSSMAQTMPPTLSGY